MVEVHTQEIKPVSCGRSDLLSRARNSLSNLIRSLDSDYFAEGAEVVRARAKTVEPSRCIPFIALHAACLAAFWVKPSIFTLFVAISLYWLRMFAITGFYHRYFSHRSFSTSRFMQFVFAVWGATSGQRGPLWWAAHHRTHHRESDKENDVHSPVQKGFLWSHIGWITSSANIPTDYSAIPDLAKYPELVLVNRFDWVPPFLLALTLLIVGDMLKIFCPQLQTSGPQLLVWGFFVSTVVLFHGTCCINSVGHIFGSRRFATDDESKNNLALALITLGEGWHNNHHRFPGAARQGIFWWEIDVTYYALRMMEAVGLVTDLHKHPQEAQQPPHKISPLSEFESDKQEIAV